MSIFSGSDCGEKRCIFVPYSQMPGSFYTLTRPCKITFSTNTLKISLFQPFPLTHFSHFSPCIPSPYTTISYCWCIRSYTCILVIESRRMGENPSILARMHPTCVVYVCFFVRAFCRAINKLRLKGERKEELE